MKQRSIEILVLLTIKSHPIKYWPVCTSCNSFSLITLPSTLPNPSHSRPQPAQLWQFAFYNYKAS